MNIKRVTNKFPVDILKKYVFKEPQKLNLKFWKTINLLKMYFFLEMKSLNDGVYWKKPKPIARSILPKVTAMG